MYKILTCLPAKAGFQLNNKHFDTTCQEKPLVNTLTYKHLDTTCHFKVALSIDT